jgi:ABC-type sugar transport system permease subunit
MGMLMIAIGLGYFGSFILFLISEEMSLKDSDFSDIKDAFTKELSIDESLSKYGTIKYMAMYVIGVFIIGLLISTQILIPNHFGLGFIMAYVFLPSMIGSLIILLVKWRFQPLLKLISSFLFGAGYIGASAFAVAVTHLLLT